MDAKTQAGAKGGAKTPESIVEEAYKGIVTECAFYATLPEHHDVSSVADYISIDIHPTKSLVVTGDALDNIVVWDYEARKIVYRTSAVQLFNDTVELINECVKNPEIPPVNRTSDASVTPMSGLRHVQFYDNDTLLWSNNSSYSPASSQFVIAVFSQGCAIIDYIAHTSVSIFYSTHLSNLQANCVLPLNGRYLLIGTNGNLCVFDTISNAIRDSVPFLNVQFLLPYKARVDGCLNYQRASSEIQVVALNSQNLAICWTLALDASNEFVSLTPAFAFANGGLCQNAIRSAVFASDLRRLLLTDGLQLISLDVGVSREGVSLPELSALGVTQSLPAAALRSVPITGGTVLEVAATLVPALPAHCVPVVDGRNSLAVVDLRTGALHRLSEPALLGSAVQAAEFRHVAVRVSDHAKIAVGSQVGVFVFSVATQRTPAVLRVMHPDLDGEMVHVVKYTEGQIEYHTFDVVEAVIEDSNDTSMPAAVRRSAQVLATNLPVSETPSLLLNADSSYLAVYFKNAKTAMLFSLQCSKAGLQLVPTQTLQSIDGFAWSYLPDKFATISASFVHIHDLQGADHPVWISGESTPNTLFGGYLLGVGLTPTEAEMRSTHLHSQQIQFFAWDVLPAEGNAEQTEDASAATEWRRHEHLKNATGRLPLPNSVLLLRENGLLLLSYHDKTAIYRIESSVELLTITNHPVQSALPAVNAVFLATPEALLLLLLNGRSVTTYTLGHHTSLATNPALLATVYSNQTVLTTKQNALLPPVQLLPASPLSLLAIFKGHLLLATASAELVAFPLSHPALRFVMLMASDQVDTALRWSQLLRPDQHDAAAYVLQSWGHIEKCLELSGLSPSLRLSFQLSRGDVSSIVKIVKKGDLSVLDEADNVDVDYRLTPVDQLPGVRRAAILLAKRGKKEELTKLFKLCQKNDRTSDAEFVAMFLYKDDPAMLLQALKKGSKYHDAALLSKLNAKLHKELPELVKAWNQQLKSEAKTTSYLTGVEMVLEEGAKRVAKKTKTAAKTAGKGKAAGKGKEEGRRRRRRG